jgi:hypothetical protein
MSPFSLMTQRDRNQAEEALQKTENRIPAAAM